MSEFIDVFVNGNGENAFSQFDIVLSGEVPFPRREVVFFKHKYWTVLGGFIYLEFCKYLFEQKLVPSSLFNSFTKIKFSLPSIVLQFFIITHTQKDF